MAAIRMRGGVAVPATARPQMSRRQSSVSRTTYTTHSIRAQSGREIADASGRNGRKALTRKELLQGAMLTAFIVQPGNAMAEETAAPTNHSMVYFDLSVDGKAEGRLTIEVFDESSIGGQRFLDLAKGKQGVGYRRSKVGYVSQEFIGVEPLAKLAYGESGISPIAGGEDIFKLEEELGSSSRKHDGPGVVSIVVKDLSIRDPEQKLKAVNGRLMNVPEAAHPGPNGTALSITTAATPALDATNLIVGRVVEGQEIIKKISALPAVKDNTASPYFMAAKAIGDKRADVAEKGFNKPYSKIVITKCGILGA